VTQRLARLDAFALIGARPCSLIIIPTTIAESAVAARSRLSETSHNTRVSVDRVPLFRWLALTPAGHAALMTSTPVGVGGNTPAVDAALAGERLSL